MIFYSPSSYVEIPVLDSYKFKQLPAIDSKYAEALNYSKVSI